MITTLTKSDRELLKTIYRLSKDGSSAHTGALADVLRLSPGTVTASIKRLAERALLEHTPYKGVELTSAGRQVAVAAIRRHRIVERFLADMLGYAWNEADALAVSFEHDLPDEVTDRLYTALHRPATCPHGFPIPQPEDADLPATPELYDLEPGDLAEIAVSGSTDAEIVSFLETLGVRPGIEVRVVEKHPFDGPLVVEVDGQTRTLGERVARQVYVTRTIRGPEGSPRPNGTSPTK